MKKHTLFLVAPFVLALTMVVARADDTELSGTVGCQHCDFEKATGATECGAALKVGDKVYVLKGDKVSKDFKKGGDWTVKGKVSDDGKSVEVTEMTKKE